MSGGTPTLALNDGGSAVYNASATALLGDPSKLVFDYTVGAGDAGVASLAITGLNAQGATVDDGAGNHANLANVTATFDALTIHVPSIPFPPPAPPPPPPGHSMGGGMAGLELHLDSPSAVPGLDLRELSCSPDRRSLPIHRLPNITPFWTSIWCEIGKRGPVSDRRFLP